MSIIELLDIFYYFFGVEKEKIEFDEYLTNIEFVQVDYDILCQSKNLESRRFEILKDCIKRNAKDGYILIKHEDFGLQEAKGSWLRKIVYFEKLTFKKCLSPFELAKEYPFGRPTMSDHLKLAGVI